jgi:hypothetical protein
MQATAVTLQATTVVPVTINSKDDRSQQQERNQQQE